MAEAGKGFVEYSELGGKIKNKSPYFLIPAFNYKSNSCKRSLQEQQELEMLVFFVLSGLPSSARGREVCFQAHTLQFRFAQCRWEEEEQDNFQ